LAGTSLLALIDDIATILDDVATMTKVATKKTAGVLGDDLALNAEQVAGVNADRELPVVWAVAKGSAKNKLILVPAALAISALLPWAITPLLMVGGAFLSYEGFEKVAHKILHKDEEREKRAELAGALSNPAVDMVAFEKDKVKGAIRTDFILSAEIIVITLGTVAKAPFAERLAVLSLVSVLMTVGVYGLVAGIVKLDDAGLALSKRSSAAAQVVGRAILRGAPFVMKGLAMAGTAAMFLVGGGILAHGIPGLEQAIHALAGKAGPLGAVVPTLTDALIGILAGALLLGIVALYKRLVTKRRGTE
jgi:uncharacterized protein